jgi:hypothetical protein
MQSILAYMRICTRHVRALYALCRYSPCKASSITHSSFSLSLHRTPTLRTSLAFSKQPALARSIAPPHPHPTPESRIHSISIPPNLHPQNARPQFSSHGCDGAQVCTLDWRGRRAICSNSDSARLFILGGRLVFLCLFCPLSTLSGINFFPDSGWNARGLHAETKILDFRPNTCC